MHGGVLGTGMFDFAVIAVEQEGELIAGSERLLPKALIPILFCSSISVWCHEFYISKVFVSLIFSRN